MSWFILTVSVTNNVLLCILYLFTISFYSFARKYKKPPPAEDEACVLLCSYISKLNPDQLIKTSSESDLETLVPDRYCTRRWRRGPPSWTPWSRRWRRTGRICSRWAAAAWRSRRRGRPRFLRCPPPGSASPPPRWSSSCPRSDRTAPPSSSSSPHPGSKTSSPSCRWTPWWPHRLQSHLTPAENKYITHKCVWARHEYKSETTTGLTKNSSVLIETTLWFQLQHMWTFCGFLTVNSTFLGLDSKTSPWTLRNWDNLLIRKQQTAKTSEQKIYSTLRLVNQCEGREDSCSIWRTVLKPNKEKERTCTLIMGQRFVLTLIKTWNSVWWISTVILHLLVKKY